MTDLHTGRPTRSRHPRDARPAPTSEPVTINDAVCATGYDPQTWFPETQEELDYAQVLCESCPLMHTCAQNARSNRETGVWGGIHFLDGQPAKPLPSAAPQPIVPIPDPLFAAPEERIPGRAGTPCTEDDLEDLELLLLGLGRA